ncbi:hypothetical protein Tsubulata_009846 [Turnera subulata]|uniref:CHASE domain-containing protein n=1 Tax=Turnera subulata TaxID=218843 RepID=A0A9Q0J8A4_9ROSI|nr:hypothetical protein Tsubulata_009846 [Turnera subulata]
MRVSGRGVLSAPFRLLKTNRLGIILTFTVYKTHLPPSATPNERIQATIGYLGAVYEMEPIIEMVCQQLPRQRTILVDVYDTTNQSRPICIYGWDVANNELRHIQTRSTRAMNKRDGGLYYGQENANLQNTDSGKLITWGSTDDLVQSYVTSGKHGEIPEPFPLPTETSIIRAAEAGPIAWQLQNMEKFIHGDGRMSPRSQGSKSTGGNGNLSAVDSRGSGGETTKRRRVSSPKQAAESSSSGDETLSALPCLVTLNPGVWGWGYGGEGQLGLGSRIRMVSSPHPVPCIDPSYGKDRTTALSRGVMTSEGQSFRVPESYVKGIACGGRHSAVITDAGALLTFGWGLYGQCGQGSADDELSPTCVSSLLGIRIEGVAAGLWHTVCISSDGDVYGFGGNQFGQLGTGGDQAETLPRLLEAPSLEKTHARIVSCGARHTAIITGLLTI